MHIKARNSAFFYFVSLFSEELRDITLFHELLNKKRQKYRMRIGAPVSAEGDIREVTDQLERYVVDRLSKGDQSCARPERPLLIPD